MLTCQPWARWTETGVRTSTSSCDIYFAQCIHEYPPSVIFVLRVASVKTGFVRCSLGEEAVHPLLLSPSGTVDSFSPFCVAAEAPCDWVSCFLPLSAVTDMYMNMCPESVGSRDNNGFVLADSPSDEPQKRNKFRC